MRLAILLALSLPASASAAPPEATPVVVSLTDFRFTPATVRIAQRRAVELRLTNDSDHGHNFVAREFFAAAMLDPASRKLVRRGAVELASHASVTLRLVAPPAGHYRLTCTHFTHAMRGMTGEIVVE